MATRCPHIEEFEPGTGVQRCSLQVNHTGNHFWTGMHEDITAMADLPYAGTSGWSGSETSKDRAEREDSDGTTSRRQRQVLDLLAQDGVVGVTWKELADYYDWHHGQASGVLSVLHKTGRIARLVEARNRCAVYVLPEYIDGRHTAPQGRGSKSVLTEKDLWLMKTMHEYLDTTKDRERIDTVTIPIGVLRDLVGLVDRLS